VIFLLNKNFISISLKGRQVKVKQSSASDLSPLKKFTALLYMESTAELSPEANLISSNSFDEIYSDK